MFTQAGMLLDMETYRQLTASSPDPELLTNISREELTALADSTLSTEIQVQIDILSIVSSYVPTALQMWVRLNEHPPRLD